jgi:hypothetical protein
MTQTTRVARRLRVDAALDDRVIVGVLRTRAEREVADGADHNQTRSLVLC